MSNPSGIIQWHRGKCEVTACDRKGRYMVLGVVMCATHKKMKEKAINAKTSIPRSS